MVVSLGIMATVSGSAQEASGCGTWGCGGIGL